MADSDELEEVCSFLRGRSIDEQTIRNFKEQKMDFQAIVMCSAEELQELGCVRGDAMNIKHFAQSRLAQKQVPGKDEKKRLLEEVLNQGCRDRKKAPSKLNTGTSRKKAVRKVNLGWLHFNESTQTYVQVKSQKGGGTRVVDLPIVSTKDVIINTGKNCFFPNGSSTFGPSDVMEFSLSNFQQQEIPDADDFTLQQYVEQFKLNRITLYLLSRRKQTSDPDISDSELEKPVFSPTETVQTVHHASEAEVPTQNLDERRQLIAEQNEEYQRSLETDRELGRRKRTRLSEEADVVKRQIEIMLARKDRVPEEPHQGEDKVLVRVRHLTFGVVERAFKPDTMVASIYDWVGSLNSTPEHFVLSNYNHDLMPTECIGAIALHTSIVLNMRESESTPPLGDDVNFRGFGDYADDLDTTVTFSPFSTHEYAYLPVPSQLMEDDSSSDGSARRDGFSHDKRVRGHTPDNHSSDSSSIRSVSPHPGISAPSENGSDQDNPPQGISRTSIQDSDSDSTSSGATFQASFSDFAANDQGARNVRGSRTFFNSGQGFRRWLNEVVENRRESRSQDRMEDLDMQQVEVRRVTVRRSDILESVLKIYMEDQDIVKCRLNVHFLGEKGIDFGGVTKDFFTSFWEAAFQTYFDGDVVKVPLLSPQKLADKPRMQALGRVLEHGWRLTGELPVRFCEASVIAVLHGEDAIPNEALERSFLWYISDFERNILCSVLEGGEVDDYKRDAVFGLYHRFSMQCMPATSQDQIREHILTMARCEFVIKPMAILSYMRSGITDLVSLKAILTVQKISELYQVLSPTCENVLKNVSAECEDLRPEEERVYNFLTVYIGGLDGDQLLKFLHFVTGSTSTPLGKGIKVCFNASQGLSRAPHASTCNNTLTISTTYESYSQFKNEFNQFLNSSEIYEMGFL